MDPFRSALDVGCSQPSEAIRSACLSKVCFHIRRSKWFVDQVPEKGAARLMQSPRRKNRMAHPILTYLLPSTGRSAWSIFPQAVSTILGHHVYGGAKPGSLFNVYVRLQYLDGSTSGKAYVPATVLEGTDALSRAQDKRRRRRPARYPRRPPQSTLQPLS